MSSFQIKRIDHHGLIAGIIDELELVENIDRCLKVDPQEKITCGQAVKGMIINALGFSNRPMTLTPQFFQNLPMDMLFQNDVQAEDLNRYKLGRTLDAIFNFGCSELFALLSNHVCRLERVNKKAVALDTTSFSFSGAYLSKMEQDNLNEPVPIKITYGYSKDHRPDQKQAVLELMVSHDGGIPLLLKSHDGNASDNTLTKEQNISSNVLKVVKHLNISSQTVNYILKKVLQYCQN